MATLKVTWATISGSIPTDALGPLIISMTRDLSDLLTVYLLAREAGLTEWTPSGTGQYNAPGSPV